MHELWPALRHDGKRIALLWRGFMSDITVFTARAIHTMEPSLPEAHAIAVRQTEDGQAQILEVGTLESLQPWLTRHPHTIDTRFADKVLLPGFIDPHLHPSMAAVILPMQFITALPWDLPWETVPATKTHEAYIERLTELTTELIQEAASEPFFTWGYHRNWHGDITRKQLDDACPHRPVVVWHRSFHEVILNSAALEHFGLNNNEVGAHPQIKLEDGLFYENGLRLAINALNPVIMSPEKFGLGMQRLKQVAHFGGHTMLGDMGIGIFNFEMEWQAALGFFNTDDTPFRVHYTPNMLALAHDGDYARVESEMAAYPELNTETLFFTDHAKLFTDGAFFSQLMMVGQPGYLDGHEGEWMMVPERFEEAARLLWHKGYKIHVHCTGDLGLELALDTLEKLQDEKPRFNHRFTIEHFGLSTPEQVRRMASLGAIASVNVYYLHELSEIYARDGIGEERAYSMARLGTLKRHNIPFALHSDYTMAPALPLNSAWVAATRQNEAGKIVGEGEGVPVYDALKAITIDAAYVLGLEHEIGSLRAGKRADFTVLEQDPFEVGAQGLRDIEIWGTVFNGVAHPIEKP
jgi:predicted amidohydrolase YtcJ